MPDRDDFRRMARALQLARQGSYTTHPNPRVGCVIVRDGLVVGEGFHARAGEPHAEVHALRLAGEQARGATAYVTLEPCAHQGRTGPCADALLSAGIARVVVAMEDPNPLVAGQGLARLATAGVVVESGVLTAEAEQLNPGFLSRMRRGRPFLRLKLASSLDGRIAMASGESQWITGAAARVDVHRLRASSDAILTGIGTVLQDDPALTCRLEPGDLPTGWLPPERQPDRIILDRCLRLPVKARVVSGEGRCRVIGDGFLGGARKDALQAAGVDCHAVPGAEQSVEPVLVWLGRQGYNELLVECGPRLAGSLMRENLVDELWLYQAPVLLGSSAMPLAEMPLTHMAQRLHWQCLDRRMLGQDLRMIFQRT